MNAVDRCFVILNREFFSLKTKRTDGKAIEYETLIIVHLKKRKFFIKKV